MKNHLLKSKGHVSFSDACFGIVRVKPNSKRLLWGISWRPEIYRSEEIRGGAFSIRRLWQEFSSKISQILNAPQYLIPVVNRSGFHLVM